MVLRRGDKLRCKICLNEFYNDYEGWQNIHYQNCPYCFHNNYWNLSFIERINFYSVTRFGVMYCFGDGNHKKYIERISRGVNIDFKEVKAKYGKKEKGK